MKIVNIVGYKGYFKAFDPSKFVLYNARQHPAQKPDLVCFTGGTDVNPELYDEERHYMTNSPDRGRDAEEVQLFQRCIDEDVPMVGICRGSQFLCVMNGGKLIQDVDNHAISGTHDMVHYPIDGSKDCQRIQVTSTHHQMAYPYCINCEDYEVVGWVVGLASHYALSPTSAINATSKNNFVEPEVVHYNKTKCLGVQGHPEYVGSEHEFRKYFNRAVLHYLFGE